MRWFSRVFAPKPPVPYPAVAAETPFYAIGDIHGCHDELHALLAQLEPHVPRVYVGDYVDRGPDSAGVLKSVHDDQNAVCLLGNHEYMLLKFIEEPTGQARHWLRHGGMETLKSYNIAPLDHTAEPDALISVSQALANAMGVDLIKWLKTRPTSYRNGNVVVVHAGADPAKPIEDQKTGTLIWGHKDFATTARKDGLWVLHGHIVVDAPIAVDGRIAIDTGAFATGRLTAAHVMSDGVTFLQAPGGR